MSLLPALVASPKFPKIEVGDSTVKSPTLIAESFKEYFGNLGPDLAKEIPQTDIGPKSFL